MLKVLLACALLVLAPAAVAADYVAGRHYELIEPPLETAAADDKVVVMELFWYGCPHCFEFEPAIEEWLASEPENVEFVRVPAVFARNWEIHARAFYAAEQLGVLKQTHTALFNALHRERRRLFTLDDLVTFYAEHGVDAEAFRTAYESFDVDQKTRRAMAITRKSGIGGVPALVVDGRYRLSTQQTGGYDAMLKVAEHLAAKDSSR
ncbi:MAG: thiol:disulfide interchange protein DsbA/DsbL [Gammaproteobacteria bacterium]